MLKFNKNKTNCTGCSACYSVCPVHCISMIPDEEGFLYPVASDVCIECRLCEKVCPLQNERIENNFQKTAFAAVAKDYSIWHRSASGGAFSEIVRHWADEDSIIVGASWNGFDVHHIGVVGFENIAPLCKSKYVSSAIEDTFIEIKKHLCSGKKVIFCGCPCQVDGLVHFLKKPYTNLLTIDLICHGQGSPSVFKKCIDIISEKLGSNVTAYEFRAKRQIIETDYLTKITTKDNTYHIVDDPYIQLFLKQDILRPSCGANCKYRNVNRPGDITIADCKGFAEIFPDLKGSKKNYSTIVCNTHKGKDAIQGIAETMEIKEYSLDDVIKYNPLFARHTWFSKNRDQFFEEFAKEPYETIIRCTKPLSISKISIKTLVKTILPAKCINFICKII